MSVCPKIGIEASLRNVIVGRSQIQQTFTAVCRVTTRRVVTHELNRRVQDGLLRLAIRRSFW